MACWDWVPYLGKDSAYEGVRAMVSSWVRVDSRSLPMQAKCVANYANSALAKMEALAAGHDEPTGNAGRETLRERDPREDKAI